jgi:hypothetical protein
MSKLVDTRSEFTTIQLPGFPRITLGEDLYDVDESKLKEAAIAHWGNRFELIETIDHPTVTEAIAVPVEPEMIEAGSVELEVAETVTESIEEEPTKPLEVTEEIAAIEDAAVEELPVAEEPISGFKRSRRSKLP